MNKRINLGSLSALQLLEIYNMISPRSVKKFSDRATAAKRVETLLEQQKKALWTERDEGCIQDLDFGSLFPADYRPAGKGHTDLTDDLKITVLVENPKRKGSMANKRFALYKTGMTIGEYKVACVKLEGETAKPPFKYLMDPRWDVPRGFISIDS